MAEITTRSEPADRGERLCASADITERGSAWLWDVRQYGQQQRAFALRFDGQVVAYINRCVHVPTQLDWQPGQFFDHDKRWIMCSLHGAMYEPANGQCIGGPCGKGRLTAITTQERDGQVLWYPSRDIRPMDSLPSDEAPPLVVPTPAPAQGNP